MHKLVLQIEEIRKEKDIPLIDVVKDLRVCLSTYYKWLSMDRVPNNKNREDMKEWIIRKGYAPNR